MADVYEIAREVFDDMRGRAGMDFDLDNEVIEEIVADWAKIIEDGFVAQRAIIRAASEVEDAHARCAPYSILVDKIHDMRAAFIAAEGR